MSVTYPSGVLAGLVTGVAFIAVGTFPLPCRLVYNPSASAPVGWYTVDTATALHVHEFIVAQLPDAAATLAAERRYLPRGVPIVKEVGALGGQVVCLLDGIVSIDGTPLAHALERDGAGRPLASWNGCRPLAKDEVFLLGRRSEASFDSRYFGPIPCAAIIGKATPLWTW